MEFQNEIGQVSFYRNGVRLILLTLQSPLGTAFDSIPPGTYYPAVCMYYGEVQVTLNPKAKAPQEEKK